MLHSVCQNYLGQARAHLGKPGKLGGGCLVDVDPFAGLQRTVLSHGAVALSNRRTWREGGEKLDLPRRLAGLGEQVPHELAGDGERQ